MSYATGALSPDEAAAARLHRRVPTWETIASCFDEMRDLLDLRFETKEEALGKKTDREWRQEHLWYDDEVDCSVRPWLMIPFSDTLDMADLQDRQRLARELAPRVAAGIAARELSMEFLDDWGRFRDCCGALSVAYFAAPANMLAARIAYRDASAAYRDASRKYWIAKAVEIGQGQGLKNSAIEAITLRHIVDVLRSDRFAPPFDQEWYEGLISLGRDNWWWRPRFAKVRSAGPREARGVIDWRQRNSRPVPAGPA